MYLSPFTAFIFFALYLDIFIDLLANYPSSQKDVFNDPSFLIGMGTLFTFVDFALIFKYFL